MKKIKLRKELLKICVFYALYKQMEIIKADENKIFFKLGREIFIELNFCDEDKEKIYYSLAIRLGIDYTVSSKPVMDNILKSEIEPLLDKGDKIEATDNYIVLTKKHQVAKKLTAMDKQFFLITQTDSLYDFTTFNQIISVIFGKYSEILMN